MSRPPSQPPVPTTPKRKFQDDEPKFSTPQSLGTSALTDISVTGMHRTKLYPFIQEALEKYKVFMPIEDFLSIFFHIPVEWEGDEILMAEVGKLLEDQVYTEALETYFTLLDKSGTVEQDLYTSMVAARNAANVVAEKIGEDQHIITYRQDPRTLLGTLALRKPDICSVLETLWKSSGNINVSAKGGPEKAIAVSQLVHWYDIKLKSERLDNGAEAFAVLQRVDGEKSDPRECVELSQHEDGIERENKRTKLAAEKAPSALTVAMQETSHQVASYAFEVLSNAGLRSHSLGLLVCGKCVQPLYFDRSVIVVGAPFDFKAHPKLFAALNIRMSKMSLVDRGLVTDLFDDLQVRSYKKPSESRIDRTSLFNGAKVALDVGGKPVVLTLGKIILRQPALIGRGTLVLDVLSVEGNEEWAKKQLVVKISFPSRTRPSEFEMVQRILNKARELDDKWIENHIPSLLHEEVLDFEKMDGHVIGKLKRYLDQCEWVDVKFEYDVRVCRFLVAEKLHSVTEIASTAEWTDVYFDAVKTHNWIYEKARILHRDVSLSNVMFRREEGKIYGVPNDYDLASFCDEPGQHSAQRTGTMPFMAVDLHESPSNPPPHLYRHDLESFFYVFLFVVCSCDFVVEGGRQVLRKNDKKGIAGWLQLDNDQLSHQKYKLFFNKANFKRIINEKEWHNDFKALKACLMVLYRGFNEGLREIEGLREEEDLREGYTSSNETLSGFVTYDLFVKAKAAVTF